MSNHGCHVAASPACNCNCTALRHLIKGKPCVALLHALWAADQAKALSGYLMRPAHSHQWAYTVLLNLGLYREAVLF